MVGCYEIMLVGWAPVGNWQVLREYSGGAYSVRVQAICCSEKRQEGGCRRYFFRFSWRARHRGVWGVIKSVFFFLEKTRELGNERILLSDIFWLEEQVWGGRRIFFQVIREKRRVAWGGNFLVVASYLRKGIFLSKNRKPIESEKWEVELSRGRWFGAKQTSVWAKHCLVGLFKVRHSLYHHPTLISFSCDYSASFVSLLWFSHCIFIPCLSAFI